ncbi:MAG: PD-(D/E)XK nuclease family protein [Deltaproteobacteria bacterium]|nr:PD-(D/E)XK nuclease family protein [Deltaproteobacteria bacterium]
MPSPPPSPADTPPAAPDARLGVGESGEARLAEARAWLRARPRGEPALVVGASRHAAVALLRDALGDGATFGKVGTTLGQLARELALPGLAESALAPLSPMSREAICARAVHDLREAQKLGRLEAVASRPGLAAALARTFAELRLGGVSPHALDRHAPDVARLFRRYLDLLDERGLVDDADVLRDAAKRARAGDAPLPVGAPLILLDVPLDGPLTADLARALVARAPATLALVPAGDARAIAALSLAIPTVAPLPPPPSTPPALARLQAELFSSATDTVAGKPPPDDGALVVLSAPGESRECVAIARGLIAEAAAGTPWERMAVLLRSPEAYRAPLVEALRRAAIPAFYARGLAAPEPAGRALLALLACAADGLASRHFAEYLSLGEVPRPDASGAPPGADAGADAVPFVPPADAESAPPVAEEPPPPTPEETSGAVVDGQLRSPRRWERLLRDAAVIGGLDRWRARLDALEGELAAERDVRRRDDADDPRASRIQRDIDEIAGLRAFALPLLEALAELPRRAIWGDWLRALRRVVAMAIRTREPVARALADLDPLSLVGPVGLDEVRLVLARHLGTRREPATGGGGGAVFVGGVDDARGRAFDKVWIPGLHERSFPQKIVEDPLLLDAVRHAIDPDGARLPRSVDRAADERLRLRLAVGAARDGVVASWARVDADKARPRVPSFYGLELLRPLLGRLPGFEELMRRAEETERATLGGGAPGHGPSDPRRAIDGAELDLAIVQRTLAGEGERGALRYLLDTNAHLARALRFRARRHQLRKLTGADGLVLEPGPGPARDALARHQLAARAFSPTALQHFADCPYRFYLQAIVGLRPVEDPVAIERLDPMHRGKLVHAVQYELMTRARAAGQDLTDRAALAAELDALIDEVAASYEAKLAPAIPSVWADELERVRADLRGWLTRLLADRGWAPWRFELGFGLPVREGMDPESVTEPVALACGLRLRGAIDLVERAAPPPGSDPADPPPERLRATDYKTGRARGREGMVIDGGRLLQPVLYALVLEALTPGAAVDGGRLFYCTAKEDFHIRAIPLDAAAREGAQLVADAVDDALSRGSLPALPRRGQGRGSWACDHCDYRAVCGPDEGARASRKGPFPAALKKLREAP